MYLGPRARTVVLASLLLITGCPPDGVEPGETTDTPGDTETTGTTGPDPGATEAPTTGTPPGDTDDTTTTGETAGTSGQDDPDSSGGSTMGSTDPTAGECPFEPPGVEAALERVEQGLATDLSTRPCDTTEDFGSLLVVAAAPAKLATFVCSDPSCIACDPADELSLALTIPEPFEGLPAHVGEGDCVRLAVGWERAGDDPDACSISGLALVRKHGGSPEPVPAFLYRYTETLPRTDVLDDFTLTAELDGPGEDVCPCLDDCCGEMPGSRRLRFVAGLGMAQIEGPPVESGDVVPAFELGTPEGDDLFGSLALVRSYVSGMCEVPPRHEWILRVTPG